MSPQEKNDQRRRPVLPNDAGYPSQRILLAHDPALLQIPAIQEHAISFENYSPSIRLWTDDYGNLFQILK